MKKYISLIVAVALFFSLNIVQIEAQSSTLKVHFIDVGQGDSCFIELPDRKTMLIDAGTSSHGDEVCDYIDKLGYSTIDYVVATHAHADHIGGMEDVFSEFKVKKCYASSTPNDTKTYSKFITAVKNEGISVTNPFSGDFIYNTKDFKVSVLNPEINVKYSDTNDSSIVMTMSYGSSDFLFTGDCSVDILEREVTKKIDVLKVSHHGSYTGTTQSFINRISPKYAVISVGDHNSYNHPNENTIKYLKNVVTYQTSLNGSVTAVTDGKTLKFSCEKNGPQNEKIKISAPKKVNVTSKNNKVTLKWSKVKGAEKYQVYMAKKRTKKYKKVKTTKNLKATVKSVKNGKKYFFKVRAYTEKNGKKYYGSFSKVKGVRVKK